MSVQIFHKGAWHAVEVPQPFWTLDQQLTYGKIYMLAQGRYDSVTAMNVAEAYVLKEVHHGLTLDGRIETALKGLVGRA